MSLNDVCTEDCGMLKEETVVHVLGITMSDRLLSIQFKSRRVVRTNFVSLLSCNRLYVNREF